jgi:hypothetical protein
MAAEKKKMFGGFEAAFDISYLAFGLGLGLWMWTNAASGAGKLSGALAFVLAGGDAFHLVPRIAAIFNKNADYQRALGAGKLITSITMTVFYVMLWHLGALLSPAPRPLWTAILYLLAALRIGLCLPRQNRWQAKNPPVNWGIYRNIPFLLMGLQVAIFYIRTGTPAFMPIAIFLSFLFYIPVVLFANKRPMVGMLMLPKTLSYVWILILCAKSAM